MSEYYASSYTTPYDIEERSMAIIAHELEAQPCSLSAYSSLEMSIIKRVIHATADFEFASLLTFLHGASQVGREALMQGSSIVTDTNMLKTGLSQPALQALGCDAYCYMADKTVASQANVEGITRAVASMRHAIYEHPGAIFAVGNAPTALMALYDLIEQGAPKPALIIAVPVGFVNVVESKTLIERLDIPAIVSRGRKGGSTVAVAIMNALLYSCYDRKTHQIRPSNGQYAH